MNFIRNLKILLIPNREKLNPKDQSLAKDKIRKSNLKFQTNFIKVNKTFYLKILNKKKEFITFLSE